MTTGIYSGMTVKIDKVSISRRPPGYGGLVIRRQAAGVGTPSAKPERCLRHGGVLPE